MACSNCEEHLLLYLLTFGSCWPLFPGSLHLSLDVLFLFSLVISLLSPPSPGDTGLREEPGITLCGPTHLSVPFPSPQAAFLFPKPALISRLERGEAPWCLAPQGALDAEGWKGVSSGEWRHTCQSPDRSPCLDLYLVIVVCSLNLVL